MLRHFFFNPNENTRINFLGFEQLFNSIAWRVMELQSGAEIVANAGFQSTNISYTGSQHVKHEIKVVSHTSHHTS